MAFAPSLARIEREKDSLKNRLAKMKAESEGTIKRGIRTLASAGTAFGMGYFAAAYPDKSTILGMPVSLAVGGAAFLADAMGWAGKEGDMVGAIGDGAIDAFACQKGLEMGAAARQAATNAAGG